jgi:hypothetical protein
MSTYRISYIRSSGWTRLGLAGAVATLFGSPMMWALGWFGTGEDALHRAVVFGLAGLWFFVGTFYVIGWALQGFVVRRAAPCAPSAPPASRPPARSGGH